MSGRLRCGQGRLRFWQWRMRRWDCMLGRSWKRLLLLQERPELVPSHRGQFGLSCGEGG